MCLVRTFATIADWRIDKNKGFLRIPQLPLFLRQMSRELSDKDIAQLSIIITKDEHIGRALPHLDRLGSELVRLYRLQESEQQLSASNQGPKRRKLK